MVYEKCGSLTFTIHEFANELLFDVFNNGEALVLDLVDDFCIIRGDKE